MTGTPDIHQAQSVRAVYGPPSPPFRGHPYGANMCMVPDCQHSRHPEADPEMLPPQEKIRFAEQLIRREHQVLGEDYLFWGNLADYLNDIAHTPDRTGDKRPAKWRDFNHAQDMATGIIRMAVRMGWGRK